MVTNNDYNYKSEIIRLISKMNNQKILEVLYKFVLAGYRKEKSAK